MHELHFNFVYNFLKPQKIHTYGWIMIGQIFNYMQDDAPMAGGLTNAIAIQIHCDIFTMHNCTCEKKNENLQVSDD